jgi:hypothetical protein
LSPASKGDRRLRVLEGEHLGNIFIYRKGELVGEWGELDAKDLCNSLRKPNNGEWSGQDKTCVWIIQNCN